MRCSAAKLVASSPGVVKVVASVMRAHSDRLQLQLGGIWVLFHLTAAGDGTSRTVRSDSYRTTSVASPNVGLSLLLRGMLCVTL